MSEETITNDVIEETVKAEEAVADSNGEGVRVEEFEISGDKVFDKVKELIRQGTVRRISLKNEEDKTLIEIPMVFGVAGAVAGLIIAPYFLAIAAITALACIRLKIVVERVDE